jgi:hypothetical protein
MRKLLLSVVVCLGVAQPAWAADLLGAKTVDTDERAPFVLAGLPDVTVGFRYGLNSAIDVAPRLRLAWAQATRAGGVGVGIGAEVRGRLLDGQGWSVAGLLRPELLIHSDARDLPSAGPGRWAAVVLDLGAGGLIASRDVAPGTRVHAGLRIHPQLYVSPQASLAWPMVLEISGESVIRGRWRALLQSELGVVVYGAGGRRDEEFTAALRIGLGWL